MSTNRGFDDQDEKIVLRLYLAGESPLSRRARTNLQEICKEHLAGRYELEMIDVFDDPLRPIQDDVQLTPTLIRVHPTPTRRIVGDLSERNSVLQELGIKTTGD